MTRDTVFTVDSVENPSDDYIFAFQSVKNKSKFQGTYAACGRENHYESDCNFHMKIRQCLAYTKADRSTGSNKAKYYTSKGDHKVHRDKVRSLQERNFISPILDLDLFLDIPKDEEREEEAHKDSE